MSRSDIRTAIYGDLLGRQDMLAALGPIMPNNQRIYAAFPQTVPSLSGNNASEGWIIFYEEQAVILGDTIEEISFFDFHVWATTMTIGETAIDILDNLYHWRIAGQNSRVIGAYNVVDSRRVHCLESYDQQVKLYRKIGRYQFRLVKTPFSP